MYTCLSIPAAVTHEEFVVNGRMLGLLVSLKLYVDES